MCQYMPSLTQPFFLLNLKLVEIPSADWVERLKLLICGPCVRNIDLQRNPVDNVFWIGFPQKCIFVWEEQPQILQKSFPEVDDN